MAIGDTKVNVGGVWKSLDAVHVKTGGAWKEVQGVYVKTGGVWQQVYSKAPPLPSGAIVAYRQSGTPTGFTDFTLANNRFIVGAGSSYGVGTTGGATSFATSGTTSSLGNHSGGGTFVCHTGSIAGGTKYYGNGSTGGHSHTWSSTVSAEDVYKNFKLIKASSEQAQLPADALMFSHVSLVSTGGVVNVEGSTDRFLRAAATPGGTGGSATASGAASIASAGAHIHFTNGWSAATEESSSVAYRNVSAGGHSHSATLTGTLNTQRRYLAAWTNASAAFDLQENAIVMWESGTPPAGWAICDGTNGTPDMRNYFVRIGSTGQMNGVAGNNSFTLSATTATAGAHAHHSTYTSRFETTDICYHSTSLNSHTHTISKAVNNIVPPYYALYFIMRLAA